MRDPAGHDKSVRARKEAGLTHRGVYVHFASGNALVAAMIGVAADETRARVSSDEVGDLYATLDAYLCSEHVSHPELGCVLGALGGEGRRQPASVRHAFSRAARGFFRLGNDALRLAAQMVGAVVLARLFDDLALSQRVLDAAKRT